MNEETKSSTLMVQTQNQSSNKSKEKIILEKQFDKHSFNDDQQRVSQITSNKIDSK